MSIARLQFESWSRAYVDILDEDHIKNKLEDEIRAAWSTWRDDRWVMGAVSEDGTLAGFAAYLVKDPVYLDNFHVAPAYHGSGVAAGLFQAGVREIAKDGGAKLWLTVLNSNARARAFYAKMEGVERPEIDDDMLGTPVRAIPVDWHDLHAVQKINI